MRPFHESGEASGYAVRGAPRGALRRLLGRVPGTGADLIAQQLGRFEPSQTWTADQLRGFFTREGLPPAEFRWASESFTFDLPVFEPDRFSTLVLYGFLPKQIARREIVVRIAKRRAARPREVKASSPPGEYGQFEIDLSETLDAGITRFEIELGGYFAPSEHDLGGDPRRLGYFLDGVALR